MRIAVLNEVQGNLPALEAALKAIDTISPPIDRIISTGDVVGRGPNPNEVIDVLRSRVIESARGNYDDAVAFDRPSSGVDFPDRDLESFDLRAVRWTRQVLTEENLVYLRALPRDMRLFHGLAGVKVTRSQGDERANEYRRTFLLRSVFGGMVNRQPRSRSKRILVAHGTTRALNEFVRSDTANSILEVVGREAEADVLITGHSGTLFRRESGGVTFVGAGSLSGPYSTPGQAQFAVVDIGETIDVDAGSVPYEVSPDLELLRGGSGSPAPYGVNPIGL